MSEAATAPQVFTMLGVLRSKHGEGCSIERMKQGVSQGTYEYSKARNNISDKAITALSSLAVGDEIVYKSQNYAVVDIEKKGANGGGKRPFGGTAREDPQITLNKNYSILHEAVLDKALQWKMFCNEHFVPANEQILGWSQILEWTKKGSLELYQEVEKKHRYQGGGQ